MKLVSMKNDPKEEAKEGEPDAPEYPYGTCLCLDEDALEKLGITKMPDLGTTFTIVATAKVTGMRASASEKGDDYKGLDLQITEMGLAPKSKSAAATLYGGDSE